MWRFAAGGLGALAGFVAVYLGLVQTEVGQRLENLALAGASYRDPSEVEGSLTRLTQLSLISFGGAIVVILLVAIARGRWHLALMSGAVMVGSIVVAEVLKAVLPRPDLVDAPTWLLPNSFPSGHAVVAVSIGIAALLVSPERLRWLVLPVSAGYAAIIAQAVQIAGWHRLSGTIGAALLVFLVADVALVMFAARGYVQPAVDGGIDRRIRRGLLAVAGFGVTAGGVVALLPVAFPVLNAPTGADSAFAHTSLDLIGMALTIVIVVLFALLIEPFNLGARPGRPAGQQAAAES